MDDAERRRRAAEAQARYVARKKAEDPEAWRAYLNEKRKRWRHANPLRGRAHTKVWKAVKQGVLIRPNACERCGKACKPEATHDDYSKPLEVEWLCRRCHILKDRPPK